MVVVTVVLVSLVTIRYISRIRTADVIRERSSKRGGLTGCTFLSGFDANLRRIIRKFTQKLRITFRKLVLKLRIILRKFNH